MNKTLFALALSAAALVAYSPAASAYQTGDWVARIGLGSVNPKSDNGTLAGTLDLEVGTDVKPTLAVSYFFTDNVAAQVLAAWPFEHDYDLNGANSGSFKHLPPTVTLQYHFNPTGPLNFYLGAGFNYTFVYDEEIAIPGAKLSLDNSFGLAAELGGKGKTAGSIERQVGCGVIGIRVQPKCKCTAGLGDAIDQCA